MAKLDVFHRYLHIVRLLMKRPATLQEIKDYLDIKSEQDGLKYTISNRTFLRDKDAIFSLFKINIIYNLNEKTYEIDEDPELDGVHHLLIDAFSTFNALQFTDDLPNSIELEKRRPKGLEYFRPIMRAINQSTELVLRYCKFYREDAEKRTVQPLLLKEHRSRWYLLAFDVLEQELRTFGLDRIEDLTISTKKFKKKSVQKYFYNAFGIICPNTEQPQEVLLSFTPLQGKYIKTMPLHHSQKILKDDLEELRISMFTYLTKDLVMEILSMGNQVRVLAPEPLIDLVKDSLQKALEQYRTPVRR